MLFLKMCKLKASSPCTWNIDDPNLLQLNALKDKHKPISNYYEDTKEFSELYFPLKPLQNAGVDISSCPIESARAWLTGCLPKVSQDG